MIKKRKISTSFSFYKILQNPSKQKKEIKTNGYDVANAIEICRTTGTRIEETTALRYEDLKDALRNGYLHLKTTKGGIARDIPVNEHTKAVIQDILKHSKKEKGRMFTGYGHTHSQAQRSIQDWIYNDRDTFKEAYIRDKCYQQQLKIDVERAALTFHGIRHYWARKNLIKR